MDRRAWSITLACCALSSCIATPVAAQVGGDDEINAFYAEPVFLPPDRKVLRMLSTAEQLLQQSRFAEAVRALSGILNSDEDYFYPVDDPDPHADVAADPEGRSPAGVRSLKNEARRLIGLLPKAARDSYELQFGAKAQRLLERAIESGDIEALSDVARTYFHTHAGYDAVVLLGRYHMDQARPLAAALCFQQVYDTQEAARYEPMLSLLTAACWQQAGDEKKASQILSLMQARIPNAAFQLGGKPVPLFEQPEEARNWLAQLMGQSMTVAQQHAIDWIMFRGNPARSGVSAGGRPLLSRSLWKQRIVLDSDLAKALELQRQQYADSGAVAVPAMQPLAVGDVILMRTPGRIAAVDFHSGKLQWQVETPSDAISEVDVEAAETPKVRQQIWLDKTHGSMSSDGDRVFVVQPRREQVIVDRAGNRRLDINPVNNLLTAYDVSRSQGKLAWSVGGPSEGDGALQQAFFLGPPLPLQGRLYVLAELGGEIRLVVLNALSGKHLWSQQLAVIQPGTVQESQRRTGGISPSFAEGVLVCPTGVGAVVAVDLTTRSLLWGYQYPETEDEPYINRGWGGMSRRVPPREPEEMWADCCAVISNGRLVITPAESDQLHCLNLSDGSLQWQIDREDETDRLAYLACIHNDQAIVVGREHIHAIDMVTGKMVEHWPLKLPAASVPCGRGFHAGRHYYLPLNSPGGGEVAVVDLDKPIIAGRAQSRNESVPGNLIAYRDQIVSQNTDWLQVYFQLDKLKQKVDARLKENPEDPWALVRQAEILTDAGKITDAVPLFRRARSIYGDAGEEFVADRLLARDLLLEALLENLDSDFAAHRESIAEIESILESVAERIDYLRILAKGQEEAGEIREALGSYFQLADTAQQAQPLLKIDAVHCVRLDRWLRSRLSRLQAKLDDGQLAIFNAEVVARRDEAVKEGTAAALQGFLNYFDAHAAAEEVREKLVAQLPGANNRIARVELLRQLAASSDVVRERAAVAQLAALYLEAGQFREAAHYFDRLRTHWADDVCWNGKTGQQLFDELPQETPARQAKFVEYPHGQVKVVPGSGDRPSRSVSYQPGFRLQLLSRRNPTLERTSVVVDQRQSYNVIGMDEYGNPEWTVSLLEGIQRNFMVNYGLSCGRLDGSLLVLSVGHQVMAIDTLRAKAGAGRPILWRQNVKQRVNANSSRFFHRRGTVSADPPPWGDNAPNQHQTQPTLARLGPITPGGVTFLRNRDLVSVDPITGETLWLRRGVTRDVELFGDDQYVFVVEPGDTDALILNAMDGSEVGHAVLPQPESRWTTIGRRVLTWRKPNGNNSRRELVLHDPLSAEDVWVHSIGRGAKGSLIDEEAVAIMDRDGRFRMIDLDSGAPLVDVRLEPESILRGIHTIASREHFVLVTNRGAAYQDGRNAHLQPMPQQHGSAMVTGRVYVFDRSTGKPRWQVPAEIKQYGLVLNQPPELPVVVFARREIETRRNRQSLSFLFLDKATGRLVVPPHTLNRTEYNFEIAGDGKGKRMTVFFQNRSSNFSLEFTGEPVPPEPPLQVEGERGTAKISSLGQALEAFRRAAVQPGLQQKKEVQKLFEVDP